MHLHQPEGQAVAIQRICTTSAQLPACEVSGLGSRAALAGLSHQVCLARLKEHTFGWQIVVRRLITCMQKPDDDAVVLHTVAV